MPPETTILPSPDTQALTSAERVLSSGHEVLLPDGTCSVPLPLELRTLLADVVRAMRRGHDGGHGGTTVPEDLRSRLPTCSA